MARASFEAAATLVGCTIGAGILGIPYVVAQAGFITGAITIILLGALMLMLNLFTGEIALRTEGDHQLPGYAERYLG
jgi:amino acid permease